MLMQQWNGLLRKEWVALKWPLLTSALFAVATMSLIPMIITRFWGSGVQVFEVALVICFLWAITSVASPVVSFFFMLERDMKRPDVWLHSNASIVKLIGSKVVFALLIGVSGLLIATIVLALHYAFLAPTILSFNSLLFYGVIFLMTSFVASISLLCIGFFFYVLYRLMEPSIKKFSIVVTIILFMVSLLLVQQMENSAFYNKIVMVGQVDFMHLKNPKLDVGNGYIGLTGTTFYTGEILFDTFFIAAVFIIATVLFDKKVRL